MSVCPSLLLRCLFASLAFRPFSDVCQVLKPDDAVWVLLNNALGDGVIGVQLQPSLSSTDDDQSPNECLSAASVFSVCRSGLLWLGLLCPNRRKSDRVYLWLLPDSVALHPHRQRCSGSLVSGLLPQAQD